MATTQRATAQYAGKPKFVQRGLFPDIICLCSAYLVATESPKVAFYRIWIEFDAGVFTVRKESGIRNIALDRRAWPFETLDDARKLFDRRIRAKTNPERKSPRKYSLVYNIH